MAGAEPFRLEPDREAPNSIEAEQAILGILPDFYLDFSKTN